MFFRFKHAASALTENTRRIVVEAAPSHRIKLPSTTIKPSSQIVNAEYFRCLHRHYVSNQDVRNCWTVLQQCVRYVDDKARGRENLIVWNQLAEMVVAVLARIDLDKNSEARRLFPATITRLREYEEGEFKLDTEPRQVTQPFVQDGIDTRWAVANPSWRMRYFLPFLAKK